MRYMTTDRTQEHERDSHDGTSRLPRDHACAATSAQYGMFIALAAIVVLFQILTDGVLLQPRNVTNLIVQNAYDPDPGHRHGDRDHRRAHRPVGRLGGRVRRRRRPRS